MKDTQNAIVIIAIILAAIYFSVVRVDIVILPTNKPPVKEVAPIKKQEVVKDVPTQTKEANAPTIQVGAYWQDKSEISGGRIHWGIYRVEKVSPDGKSILMIELIEIKGDDLYYPKGKKAWLYLSNDPDFGIHTTHILLKEENRKLLSTIK